MPLAGPLKPGWLNESVYVDHAGIRWVTLQEASLTNHLPTTSLYRWSCEKRGKSRGPKTKGCRYLPEGRPIKHQWIPPSYPRRVDQVLVLLEDDVKAAQVARDQCGAATQRATARGKPYKDDEGVFLTLREFEALYKEATAGFLDYWSKRPSRRAPGRKAPFAKSIPARSAHGPKEVAGYCNADIDAILAGEESEHINTGERGKRLKKQLAREARKFLKSYLRKQGPQPAAAVIEQAQMEGIGEGRLWRAKRELKVKATRIGEGAWYWHLPCQRLPEGDEQKAIAFLEQQLDDAGGHVPVKKLRRDADKAGIKLYVLRCAAKRIDVEPRLNGRRWEWRYRPAKSEDDAATKFLKDALREGPVASAALLAWAADAGITRHTLLKAKAALGIEHHHKKDGPYYWCLPGQWTGQRRPFHLPRHRRRPGRPSPRRSRQTRPGPAKIPRAIPHPASRSYRAHFSSAFCKRLRARP